MHLISNEQTRTQPSTKGTQKHGIREKQRGNFVKSTVPMAKAIEYKIKELAQ